MVLAMVREVAHGMGEEATRQSLEEIYESVDKPGFRVELLDGRLVVSPPPIGLHTLIVVWLSDTLCEACREHGWNRYVDGAVELPATSDWVKPDLYVCPVDESAYDRWLTPAKDVLLAVEVVSPSSRRDDHETKRDAYARSRVPVYLVIDPRDAKITLYSGPGPDGYARTTTVPVGDKLDLPEPFGITLDTGTMPGRPARERPAGENRADAPATGASGDRAP
jgi:Uma2 family endonuclease